MSRRKISWEYANGFVFYFEDNGVDVAFSDWSQLSSECISELAIINEFIDNGFGFLNENKCFVDAEYVLRLGDVDKAVLGLPDSYPYEIYIQSVGQLNQESFIFKYGFYNYFPHGNKIDVLRTGPLLELDGRIYLLSYNQYLVCEALEEFNSLPIDQRSVVENFKSFAQIKNLSREAACLLDSYLESENVVIPGKIKIDLRGNQGCLELVPQLDVQDPGSFVKNFDLFREVKDYYKVTDNEGNGARVVFDTVQKTELGKIKSKRRIENREEIEAFIEQPELFFDEATVDLTQFYGERVKEIGFYKPKFYPFVCPYKSEWIPGIEIRDRVEGTKRVYFKEEEDLYEFEKAFNGASEAGLNSFFYEGSEFDLETAKKTISVSRRQFESPKEAIKEDKDEKGSTEMLIILENADLLEYSEANEFKDEIEHKFHEIANLNVDIKLKEHQVEGVSWLQSLFQNKVRGCLLADDMGLGKTLQLLYFIEWHAQYFQSEKPYLIVAPVALLENWQNEYDRFFSVKSLEINLLYGSTGLKKQFCQADLDKLQRRQLILINYETLRLNQFSLCAVDYSVVVLDEAQKIKTPGTLITNVTKAIKADFKIAMTGTPVENTLIDLWCIMDFSVPGLLGNAKDFAKKYQNPLKNLQTDLASVGEQLRKEIGVFIKRRLKKDVAKDLPVKNDNQSSRIRREMPPAQWERYNAEIELAKGEGLQGVDKRNQILRSIWSIRDISDHPFLISEQIGNYSSDELIESSAKLQVLVELLDNIRSKADKVIIFADRKETQKMLQKVVYEKYDIITKIINGDTPTTARGIESSKLSRQQSIDQFQSCEGFNVIVMSQLAAGVGLNVTKANHVIHYSRHWNPAKEEQATDRAYRIGQEKDVYVYYPMAVFPKGKFSGDGNAQMSFDEVLDGLLQSKKNLATNTLFPTEQAEVTPEQIFGSVFGMKAEESQTRIQIDTVDKLTPSHFEAFIAALYSAMGYEVYLTPQSNDKGADVVAIGEKDCFLIQAKQTKSTVGIGAIQEILGANRYYAGKFKRDFTSTVITNGSFGNAAYSISEPNNVLLLGRLELLGLLATHKITMKDIIGLERNRLSSI